MLLRPENCACLITKPDIHDDQPLYENLVSFNMQMPFTANTLVSLDRPSASIGHPRTRSDWECVHLVKSTQTHVCGAARNGGGVRQAPR